MKGENQKCVECGKNNVLARGLCSNCYQKYRKSKDFMFRRNEYIGKRYGKLVVVQIIDCKDKHGHLRVICRCDCGNEVETDLRFLKSNQTTSCGCYQKECAKKQHKENITFDEQGGYYSGTNVHSFDKKISQNNTSGIKGVYFNKQRQKWQAYITICRKKIHLGFYNDIKEAEKARKLGEEKYFLPIKEQWNEKYNKSEYNQ